MSARVEVWSLGAGRVAEIPAGVEVRRCVTRDFGRVVREGVEGAVWGWVREDGRPDPAGLARAYPGVVVDLELATWHGRFSEDDARRLGDVRGVTTHGYPVGRFEGGLRWLAQGGARVYPQIYRPSRPTVTAAKFAQIALAKWAAVGFAPSAVVPLVAASDGPYALEVAASALREGAGGVGLWGWTRSPSERTRDLMTRCCRLAYPV